MLSNTYSPLDYNDYINPVSITFQPAECLTQSCDSTTTRAKIKFDENTTPAKFTTLDISTKVTFQKIDFDGSIPLINSDNIFLASYEEIDYYKYYCPYYTTESTGDLMSDKFIALNRSIYSTENCKMFSSLSFFIIHKKGHLILKDVNFMNFRREFYSIIKLEGGKLEMINVNFQRIYVSNAVESAVIVAGGCENGTFCGEISYDGGTVSYLNDGFEYNENLTFSGFIKANGIDKMIIQNVKFEKNLVYHGNKFGDEELDSSALSEYQANNGRLIYVIDFNSVSIDSCIFINNLVSDGLLYFTTSAGSEYPLMFDTTDRNAPPILIGYGDTHISLTNLAISNNFSTNSIIDITFLGEIRNIAIISVTFTNNASKESTLLNIFSSLKLNRKWIEDGTESKVIKNIKYMNYFVPKKFIKLESIKFTKNIGFTSSAFIITEFANVSLKDVIIETNTLEKDITNPNINTLILEAYLNDNKTYIEKEVKNPQKLVNNNLAELSKIYHLSISTLYISQNIFEETDNTLTIKEIFSSFKITSSNISSNSAITSTDSMIEISKNTDLTIEDTVFDSNRRLNTSSTGALSITGSITSLYLTRCQFLDNSAATAAGLMVYKIKKLVIDRCVFSNNEAHTLNIAGFLYVPSTSALNQVIITETEFKNNRASLSNTGCFAIEKAESMSSTLLLEISNSKFTGNHAGDKFSIFYIDDTVKLDSSSLVNYSEFSSNQVDNTTGIGLSFVTGVITFKNSKFFDNKGGKFILMNADTGEEKNGVLSRVIIEDCEVYSNQGNSLIASSGSAYFTKLFTKNLKIHSNIGISIVLDYAYIEDNNSVIESNSASYAPALLLESESQSNMKNTKFLSNSSSGYAGAISVKSDSEFKCTSCTFEYNSSVSHGGVIFLEQNGYATLYSSRFLYNTSGDKGSVIFSLGCSASNTILKDCIVESNYSKQGSAISLIVSKASIKNTTFRKNASGGITPGISLNLSDLTVTNCVFEDQIADQGAFIYATTESTLYVHNSSFTNGKARIAGAISLLNSVAEFYECEFSKLDAYQTGGLVAYSYSSILLDSCILSNIKSQIYPSIVNLLTSNLKIINSNLYNFQQTAILMASGGNFTMEDSSIYDGSGIPSAGFYCIECESMYLKSSEMNNLIGEIGSAISIYYSKVSNMIGFIERCSFNENIANDGGVINAYNTPMNIKESIFRNNSATAGEDQPFTGNGGAVYLYCHDDRCRSYMKDNEFVDNKASRNGGGVYYDYIKPENIYLNTYSRNQAIYGNNIASYASYYKVKFIDKNGSMEYTNSQIEVASGQVIQYRVDIELYDEIDQLVTTDSYSDAAISAVSESTNIGGITRVPALKGIYSFQQLVFTAEPGSSIQLNLDISGIDATKVQSNSARRTYEIIFEMQVRYCIIGEYETSKDECIPCNIDTYSLEQSATLCKTCPKEAVCKGADQVFPLANYWRTDFYSDTFFECLNPDACLGHDNYTSYTGACEEGYEGNLCQSCSFGYSRTLDNVCQPCPNEIYNTIRLIGIGLAFIVIIIFTIKSTMKSALEGLELHSIYIRIFANYIQLVSFIGAFKINWPNTFKNLLNTQDLTGSATQQVFSVDCYLEASNDPIADVFFIKLTFLFLAPFLIMGLSTLFWGIYSVFKRNKIYLKSHLLTTVIVLLFLFHPDIVEMTFSAFSCMQIEPGEFYLYKDLEIKCWDSHHMYFALFVGIPCLIAWVIGIPAACLIILYKYRYSLTDTDLRSKLGFLYMGYKHKYYFWEILIIYRKIAVAFISVFLSSTSIEVQGLSVLLLIFICYVLQTKCMPYAIDELNNLESASILISGLTIYCGLYFMTGEMSFAAEIGFFLLVVGVNIYFVLYWIKGFMVSYFIAIMKKKPQLVKRILGFSPRLFNYVSKEYDKFMINLARIEAEDKALEIDKDKNRLKEIIFHHRVDKTEDSTITITQQTKTTLIDVQDQYDQNLTQKPEDNFNLFERRLAPENLKNLFESRLSERYEDSDINTTPRDTMPFNNP